MYLCNLVREREKEDNNMSRRLMWRQRIHMKTKGRQGEREKHQTEGEEEEGDRLAGACVGVCGRV